MVFWANTYVGWTFSIPLSLLSLQRLFQTFTVIQLCHCTNTKLHVTNIQAHHQWYNDQAKTEHYENILRKMMMVLTSSFIEYLKIVTIANFQHVVSRICICTEPDIRICGIKLYKNDIHNTNLPLHHGIAIYKQNYFTMFFFRLIPLLFLSDG